MAGAQISTSVTIINSLAGFQAISLTEFDTSAESSIAAGSKVEIASAFFTFATDESISGFSSITTGETCYIALTPAGTAGSQTVSAAWVSAAPVWDDAKQGWYTTTSSSIRVVGKAVKNGATSCEEKTFLMPNQGNLFIDNDLSVGGRVKRSIQEVVPAGARTSDAAFHLLHDFFGPYMSVGAYVPIAGDSGAYLLTTLIRNTATQYVAQGWDGGGTRVSISCEDGNATIVGLEVWSW